MKLTITFLLTFLIAFFVNAQTCPYLTGAMINACNSTASNEGTNEFITFNTGSNPFPVNNLKFAYASASTTPPFSATSIMYINASVVGSIGTKPATLTLSGCTNINIMSAGQTIPANSNAIIMYTSSATTSFNLAPQCTGGNTYVVFINTSNVGTITGTSGFLSAGNFSNNSTTNRYLNITNTASPCSSANNVVAYIGSWTTNIDGNNVTWSSTGVATYSNAGCFSIALPITYSNFEVKQTKSSNELYWSTLSERNNQYFSIELSKNGADFEEIGQLKAAGNSNEEMRYAFSHKNASKGINYYRIRQFDFDGQSTLSDVKTLRNDSGNNSFWLFPTATSNNINVMSEEPFEDNDNLEILNLTGQVLFKTNLNAGSKSQQLDVSNLPKGQYFLRIIGSQNQDIQRFTHL